MDILDWRQSNPLLKPEVIISLSYEELEAKGIMAQEAFLSHQSYCPDCSNSWGHPAGVKFQG